MYLIYPVVRHLYLPPTKVTKDQSNTADGKGLVLECEYLLEKKKPYIYIYIFL